MVGILGVPRARSTKERHNKDEIAFNSSSV